MKIRTKVIVSLINAGQVLLAEGYDSVRDFVFHVPLGGGVEFGERLTEAAARELAEEIGLENQEFEFINFHESLFEFEGVPEHEIMYHFVCHISDETRQAMPAMAIESSGEEIKIAWHTTSQLEAIRENVVPPTIYEEIRSQL